MSDQTLLTEEQPKDSNSVPEETLQEELSNPDASDETLATLLSSIKNEEGNPKYKDVPTALEALKHSQEFIAQLRSESEALKAKLTNQESELGKQTAVEDFVSQLQSSMKPQETAPEQPSERPASLTVDDLDRLLAERESKKLQETNINTVKTKIATAYGDKANEFLTNKAKELGMSIEDLASLSAKSPQAALSLLGQTGATPAGNVQRGSVNSASLPNRQQDRGPSRPETSMMRGAKTKDLDAYMQSLIDYHTPKN
jgi:hypothetical protein